MKINFINAGIVATCLGMLVSGSAFGQACAPNGTAITAPITNVAGNNCNNNLAQAKICQAETLNGAGIDIYKVTLGATNNFSITVTSSAFAPELGLTSTTTCSSNQPCAIDQSPLATATAPFSVTGTASALPAGDHYIFVADVGGDNPGCGAYNLTVTAQLPVELKNFSVD